MIVSGSQQALDVTSRVLLDAGQPGVDRGAGLLAGAKIVLIAAGCRIVPVPVDRDGLNVAAGIAMCRNGAGGDCGAIAPVSAGRRRCPRRDAFNC